MREVEERVAHCQGITLLSRKWSLHLFAGQVDTDTVTVPKQNYHQYYYNLPCFPFSFFIHKQKLKMSYDIFMNILSTGFFDNSER